MFREKALSWRSLANAKVVNGYVEMKQTLECDEVVIRQKSCSCRIDSTIVTAGAANDTALPRLV